MFLQVFSFIYGAFWISVEAENVVEVAVVFVGRYLRCISLFYAPPFVADEIQLVFEHFGMADWLCTKSGFFAGFL